MRRIVPALVDLAAGLVFVAIALFAARVLLQSRLLVYVCFPLLCTAALVIGFWRGRSGSRPVALIAVLATLPLFLLAMYFFSGRNRPFMAFPVVVLVFVAAGAALPRTRAKPLAVAIGIVAMNVAAAVAGPLFVKFLAQKPNRDGEADPVRDPPRRRPHDLLAASCAAASSCSTFWATWCVPCRQELRSSNASTTRRKEKRRGLLRHRRRHDRHPRRRRRHRLGRRRLVRSGRLHDPARLGRRCRAGEGVRAARIPDVARPRQERPGPHAPRRLGRKRGCGGLLDKIDALR